MNVVYTDIYINLSKNMRNSKRQATGFILSKEIYRRDLVVKEILR